MEKIKVFFKNKENMILFLISLLLTANSIIFVIQKTRKFPSINISDHSSFILIAYFFLTILFLGTISFFSKKFEFRKIIERIVLVYFSTEIIILYGLEKILCRRSDSICLLLNNALPIFTVIYFLLIGYLIILYRKKIPSGKPIKLKEWVKNQKWPVFLIIFIVFILNIGFGNYHLSKKAYVDEALWTFDRIPKFWNNVLDGEWYKTHISDKPGITVALTSGTGLLFVNPKEYKEIKWQGQVNGPEKNILNMNFSLRFPILIFNALMLFIFYFFIEKLLGKMIAVISTIFIGLSPILLGISTMINPDALLWVFLPLSMLSYFVYKKEDRNAYLYWSGVFLGLSLLTKYVANILYVFFFLIIFLDFIFNSKNENESISKYLKRSLIDYFSLIFFSLLTFLVLLPASWVEISRLLQGTILSQAFQKVWFLFLVIISAILTDIFLIKGRATLFVLRFFSRNKKVIAAAIYSIFLFSITISLANTYLGMKWFNFESILASPKSSYLKTELLGLFLANFYSFIFGILPIALLSLIFFSIKNIKKKTLSVTTEEKIGIYLIIFIILYYLASTVNNVSATVRYQIVIYPIAFIISAIGLKQFLNMEKIKKYVPEYLAYFILIIFSIYSINFIKPFYFSYASDLLPQKYVLNLKDMGDGSYEAAQYLNSLPNAKDLVVWTDKNGVCTFFLGQNCMNDMGLNKGQARIDYFVVSAGRKSRTSKMTLSRFNGGNQKIIRLDEFYNIENPDFYLKIGGRPNNFVKVISAESVEIN